MKYSQPYMTLYYDVICLNCGGNIEHKLESLIIILYSSSLASLIPLSFVSLTRILCSSSMDTWSNNFGACFGYILSSNNTLRKSSEIGDWTTWGWRVIHV